MEERGTQRIPSLDGIRAVSIAVVFLAHAGMPIGINGSSGVTVFFFLSGFLITTLLRTERDRTGRISMGGFYLRRALRILPAMYVAATLGMIAAAFGLVAGDLTVGSVAAQYGHLTNYWILIEGRENLPAANLALWSLAVEEHFYLGYPLLLLGLFKVTRSAMIRGLVLAGVCAIVFAWRWHLVAEGASFDRVYLTTDARLDSILLGCVFAFVANPALTPVRGPRWLWVRAVLPVSLVVFYLAQAAAPRWSMTVGYELEALCLAGILTTVIAFPDCAVGRLLNHRWMIRLGVLSYSAYLLHELVIGLVAHVVPHGSLAAAFVAAVGTLAGAAAMYRWVEAPALRLRHRLKRPVTAPVRTRS